MHSASSGRMVSKAARGGAYDLLNQPTMCCLACVVELYVCPGRRKVGQDGGGMKRWGFLPEDEPALATLVLNADQRLFKSIYVNPCHVLQIQLPDVENTGYNLCC